MNDLRKKKSSGKKKTIVVISILAVLCILAVGAVALLKNYRPLEQKPATTADPSESTSKPLENSAEIKEKSVNILVCGLDESEILTDVIMLVSFDIENKQAQVLQIPRDSYIGDEYISGKINTRYGHPKDGQTKIGALIEIINQQYKLPIDHYVTVTIPGFRDIVDSMGGVKVDIPQQINYLPGKVLYPGEQVLDGEKAEWFVRYRAGYANADIGRVGAQKLFLKGLMDAVKEKGRMAMTGILTQNMNNITTDMSVSEILAYAGVGFDLNSDDIDFYVVPGEGLMHNGYAVYAVDVEGVADILNEHFRDYTDKVPASELEIPKVEKQQSYNNGGGGNGTDNQSDDPSESTGGYTEEEEPSGQDDNSGGTPWWKA
ncbi:LCP family protein [Zongyangia hominis]|uniref:LCP family protein n=1 Tax=Zongyangia hominis TaxID=2763677 RepID=A0A926I5U6_9FIRM|nr:LCP family protein [Zongyangia hominis]MBC8569264.1 LCP family protein [Zongyangia hominis]